MKSIQIHSSDLRNKKITNVPLSVPLAILNEDRAVRNHSQTLERLHQRGGIGVCEALDIIDGGNRRWREENQEDVNELNSLIKNHESKSITR